MCTGKQIVQKSVFSLRLLRREGYGFESLRAVCNFALTQGNIRRLTATVTAGNIASRRLLAKTGFQLEGELRESYFLSGQWHNDWLFGLLKKEFPFS